MAKKCPPGVFCVENTTLFFIFICICGILFTLNHIFSKKKLSAESYPPAPNIILEATLTPQQPLHSVKDILGNPYDPPLRDERIYMNNSLDPRGMPINVPTQSFDSAYRQVGILTRDNGTEMILPLMGRPLFSNRDKWNYYTISDSNNMVKLPISSNGRSCTGEYGCNNLYNGDSVYVEGYNDAFKATIYDSDTNRYIPYL